MQVVITGITGRIGANLAAQLVVAGHNVRGLVWPQDPRTEKFGKLDIELEEGSLTEIDDVVRVTRGADYIYHLGAAFQGGGPFTEADYFDINVRGTFNMLEAARKLDSLSQFYFASTDALYAKYTPDGLSEPIQEDTMPRRPAGWYALSKSLGEELCNGYVRTSHLPVTTLRFCLAVGAGEILDFRQFYLSSIKSRPEIAEIWDGEEKLVVLKDQKGRAYKKHIADVRDIVQGCFDALGKEAAIGQIIQLAGPAPFTWDKAVPFLAEKTGQPVIEVVSGGTPTFYEFDLSKSRNLLGFEPQYDIVRMIDDAIAFRNGEDIGVLPT